MELNHLRYFREVARMENISQAAKALFITQPALSATIKRLEAELGFELFTRSGNRIKLTEAGQYFLSYVNTVFSLLDEGVEKSRALANQAVDEFRVASGFGVLRNITREYLQENQDEKIRVKCCPTEEIIERLVNGRADAGYVLGYIHDSRFDERVIMTGKFYIFVNGEHPLADREYIKMADLEGQLLFCSNIAKTHELASRLMQRARVHCDLLTLDEKSVLFSAAEKGLGAVFCMPMMDVHEEKNTEESQNCRFIPIIDCPEPGMVVMLHRKDVHYSENQMRFLRYTELRFARNEEWIEEDWRRRGIS